MGGWKIGRGKNGGSIGGEVVSKIMLKNLIMKEVIILEINEPRKSQLVQGFLQQKKIDYRILAETQLEQHANLPNQKGKKKLDIFANYDQAIKSNEREKELKLWDNADLDEQLNTDGKWWK